MSFRYWRGAYGAMSASCFQRSTLGEQKTARCLIIAITHGHDGIMPKIENRFPQALTWRLAWPKPFN